MRWSAPAPTRCCRSPSPCRLEVHGIGPSGSYRRIMTEDAPSTGSGDKPSTPADQPPAVAPADASGDRPMTQGPAPAPPPQPATAIAGGPPPPGGTTTAVMDPPPPSSSAAPAAEKPGRPGMGLLPIA